MTGYLDGLRRELERVPEDRKAEVQAEIDRAEKQADGASAGEVEARKQARTGRRVERAVNKPGGRGRPAGDE